MFKFDSEKFIEDVNKKRGWRTISECAKEAGLSYAGMWRILNGATPDMKALVNILQWLKKPFEHYIKKEARMKK